MKLELRINEDDRKKLDIPGPEWLMLDTDWVRDQPADYLMRWEAECGYAIERAINEMADAMSAHAVLVLLWLARKQGGYEAGGRDDDGDPEAFSALQHIRTMRVSARLFAEPKAGDADPPATTPEPSSEGDGSGTS
jgi:hypothetical protein